MGSRSATTFDAHIGERLRERRLLLGLSGAQLAELIGVATQQIHKYETGPDRISAGRLYEIASALGTPIAYFYERLDGKPRAGGRRQRLLLEFIRNYAEISNEKHQEVISQAVRLLADR